jgi:hypothetical protein
MQVHTLQAGEEVLIDGRVRVRVLEIQQDRALLEITEGGTTRVVTLDAPAVSAPPRVALTALPSDN